MNEYSQETLCKVEQNDDTLQELRIGSFFPVVGTFKSNGSDFSRLGSAIGRNTYLKKMYVSVGIGVSVQLDDMNTFYDGLRRNLSICDLGLTSGFDGTIHNGHEILNEILKIYQSKSRQLTSIHFTCLPNWGDRALVIMLRSCTYLTEVGLEYCSITDEQLISIVEAVRVSPAIEILHLEGNRIGDGECLTLSTLLEDSACNIHTLTLNLNEFGVIGATTIINSLANNTKLLELCLTRNLSSNTNDHRVEDIISSLLCCTSSISNTYLSNHTLQRLILPGEEITLQNPNPNLLSEKVSSLLELNKGTNKSHVAIKKIQKCHPNIDMAPLFEWDAKEGEQNLKALPYVAAWFDKAKLVVEKDEESYNIDARKLSGIFQFAMAMPLLLEGIKFMDI